MPADMHGAERFVRLAEPRHQVGHRLKADAHHVARPILPVGERIEPRHGGGQIVDAGEKHGHYAMSPRPARRRRRPPSPASLGAGRSIARARCGKESVLLGIAMAATNSG